MNRALKRQVLSREALRVSHEPLLTIVVAMGLYVTLVQWELSFAKVMVLVLLLAQVLSRFGKVQRQYQEMVIFESAYWSLEATIQAAQQAREKMGGDLVPYFTRAIQLDQVSFAYGDRPVLREISLTIPHGSFISIVGSSGVGKTTVADLVIGLLQPQKGRIWIDDLPLNQINMSLWRAMIGYVPQESLLLHDTIFRNVTLGDPDLGKADVENALQAAGAWEFVEALPEGIDSSVGERGTALSGGQRQRIAIARALVRRPKLLILDEATSALDQENEMGICTTLRQLRGEFTILAISHQSAFVDTADRVYRLENGVVSLIADRSEMGIPSGDFREDLTRK